MSTYPNTHLQDELANSPDQVTVDTKYGTVTGRRALNGAGVFLEIPYALPPGRWEDLKPLPDGYRYEEGMEYIHCAQPKNDGQAEGKGLGIKFEDKVGFGEASENPLFLNIVVPPSFTPGQELLPVQVYFHGGFLQFGSPHGLPFQAQYYSARDRLGKQTVRVNIGYRVSIFGFLASEEQGLTGNYGFKDQWVGLQWVQDNISAFGGDPGNVQITGVSAGSHSIHQHLHHASHLPDGQNAPFVSAIMQSNAIALTPKTPAEYQGQYNAVCTAVGLDPSDPSTLATLKDPSKVPASKLCELIETDNLGEIYYGTFRGAFDASWVPVDRDMMEYQVSGDLARNLLKKGVKSVAIGDVYEEWYLYSIPHGTVDSKELVKLNLMRYYRESEVDMMMKGKGPSSDGGWQRTFGEILADWQVYIPARQFAVDMVKAGFPVFRYVIKWAPESVKEAAAGYVTHGTDIYIWHYRLPTLEEAEVQVVDAWLDKIDEELAKIENNGEIPDPKTALFLNEDTTIAWETDDRWFSQLG
ncbi:carboxylesterase [Marasmius fiardii PR-910]|nr:carboxylesterase [Marasmius fiardii PR-910]